MDNNDEKHAEKEELSALEFGFLSRSLYNAYLKRGYFSKYYLKTFVLILSSLVLSQLKLIFALCTHNLDK